MRFRKLRIKVSNAVDSISTLPRSVHKSKCSGKKHEVTFIKHKANVHSNINTSMLVTEKNYLSQVCGCDSASSI